MGARNGYVARAGYKPNVDGDNRFQSEAIHELRATKAVVLFLPRPHRGAGREMENFQWFPNIRIFAKDRVSKENRYLV